MCTIAGRYWQKIKVGEIQQSAVVCSLITQHAKDLKHVAAVKASFCNNKNRTQDLLYIFFESCSIPSTCYTLSSVIKTQLSLNITAPGEMQFCLDQGIRGYDLWIP